jgi:hypothetical protein
MPRNLGTPYLCKRTDYRSGDSQCFMKLTTASHNVDASSAF